jgi:hypothetical protein
MLQAPEELAALAVAALLTILLNREPLILVVVALVFTPQQGRILAQAAPVSSSLRSTSHENLSTHGY